MTVEAASIPPSVPSIPVIQILALSEGRLSTTNPPPDDPPRLILGTPVPSAVWAPATVPTLEEKGGPPVFPDAWVVENWKVKDGLPQNSIRTLHQTPDGYLWVGTAEGLSRFDGRRFVRFDEKNSPELGLTSHDIRCLTSDTHGRLHVGAVDGVLRLEEGRFQVVVPRDPNFKNRVRDLAVDPSGTLWVATERGLRTVVDGRFSTNGIPPELSGVGALSVVATADWVVWIRNVAGLYRWPIAISGPVPSGSPGQSIVRRSERSIWIHSGGSVVGVGLDGQEEARIQGPASLEPADFGFKAHSVSSGRDGEVSAVVGIRGRLFRSKAGTLDPVMTVQGKTVDEVTCVIEDAEGNLWCGTRNAGLLCLRRQTLRPLVVVDPVMFEKVYSVCEGAGGSIWGGSPWGATEWSRDQVRIMRFPMGTGPMGGFSILTVPTGIIWAGFPGGSVVSLGPTTQTLTGQPIPAGTLMPVVPETVRVLYRMRSGMFLVGNRQGLFANQGYWTSETDPEEPTRTRVKFTPGWRVINSGQGLGHDDVRALLEDRSGNLWVGTYGGGISQIRNLLPTSTNCTITTFNTSHGLSHDRAWVFHEDQDGAIWIGTAAGLNRLKDGKFFTFTTAHGLFDDLVNQILEDDFGRFWIGCNRGIYRVDRSALNAVASGQATTVACAVYGEADGMLSAETTGENQPAGCKASDGRLYFATQIGVVMIDPREHRAASPLLSVLIEQVVADGNAIAGEGAPRAIPRSVGAKGAHAEGAKRADKQSIKKSGTLVLEPGTAHTLAIRYTTGAASNPDRVRFRHRLVGLTDRWQDGGDERVAHYNHLKPGRYRFEVRAANQDGVWSPDVTSLEFTLRPFFTQTWAFVALCALAVIGAAGGLQAYRLRFQRRLLLLQQQHALELERARIARDMHDRLGANLSRIALESRSTGVSQTQVRETLRELKDLIWSVNPKNDSLAGLADFLADAAQQYLEAAGIGLDLDWPPSFPSVEISGTHRQHVTAAFKEALRNVVQHAQATEVRICLALSAPRLEIEISDNGRGFDPTQPASSGNGLRNLKERLEECGGSCDIASIPGEGTRIRFLIPLNRSANE